MALYALAEHYEYNDTKEKMIRDRLVVGIRDCTLSERLQMEPELTLRKPRKSFGNGKLSIIKGRDSKSLEEVRSGSHGHPSKRKGTNKATKLQSGEVLCSSTKILQPMRQRPTPERPMSSKGCRVSSLSIRTLQFIVLLQISLGGVNIK